MNKFRAPAVPLILNDPFLSIWSFADKLYDTPTRHWTGAKNSMVGMVKYGTKVCRFMGTAAADSNYHYTDAEVIKQKSVEIRPTTTKYVFGNEDITLEVEFISPLLADDLLLLSRPASYISYKIIPKTEDVEAEVYFDIACECTVDKPSQSVKLFKGENGVYCGNTHQPVLEKCGDDMRIDWGYLHLLEGDAYFANALRSRDAFIRNYQTELLDEGAEYEISEANPVMAVVKKGNNGVITLAYDDIKSIEYFDKPLDAYYKSNGDTFDDMCKKAMSEFEGIKQKCIDFDTKLIKKAKKISREYAEIMALTYRQTIAAHKLCFDEKGMLFISKECYSNGCAATLDVTYPSIPLFLVLNPDLVKAMLRPIFDFAKTEKWSYSFAPHDVGCYPKVNGQVYGLDSETGELKESEQMPVEECGNALICTYAVCKAENSFAYAEENRELLMKWGKYLLEYGFDPGTQLCTDDFGGHLNHNCNLSVKAIIGIYTCGILFCDKEMKNTAKEYAKKWKEQAADGEKYRMAFDAEDTWSIKYNMVWDKLFGFNLFDEDIYESETRYYQKKMTDYGIPLDHRNDNGKLDWIMWAAILSKNADYRKKVICSVHKMINTTKQRVPLTDWFHTETAEGVSWKNAFSLVRFTGRSVVGAFAILLLEEAWR